MAYKLIAAGSYLARNLLLPNPFDSLTEPVVIKGVELNSTVLNWIVGIIIAPIAYLVVGCFYSKGEAPALGAFAYLIVYTILTGIVYLLGIFSFKWYGFVLVIACIALLFFGAIKVGEAK